MRTEINHPVYSEPSLVLFLNDCVVRDIYITLQDSLSNILRNSIQSSLTVSKEVEVDNLTLMR